MLRAALILVSAAILEVGGDAMMRSGLQHRVWMLVGGAVMLAVYGMLVNQGGLDFGRLMGVYIAVFFVVAQAIAFIAYKQIPGPRLLIGGALIVTGGLAIIGG